ncbi:MAG: hypothetical protein EOO13_08455 [Chitinophagaceae bacterium]|nr:MAG: hypothetical protein EOO13_08455 [Chitinophagaceae bacterium]
MNKLIALAFLLSFFACNQTSQKEAAPNSDSLSVTTASSKRDSINVSDSAAGATVVQNRLIVPGKSIGLTKIGQLGEETAKQLGKPDEGDAAMGKSLSTWYSKNNPAYKTQVFSVLKPGDKEIMPSVKTIRVNNPFFETNTHLKAGSSLKEILSQFPALLIVGTYTAANEKTIRLYDDSEGGIGFEIDEQDLCVGVCVHPSGDKAFMQYLPFENTFKPKEE